jgi:predicted O-methyltransferase YrrM
VDCATTIEIADTIHGWMTRLELQWLFETARSVPPRGVWVELGSWKGRSLFTVAMGLTRGARLIAVDSFTPAHTALAFVPTPDWVWDHFQVVVSAVRRLRQDLHVEVVRQDTAAASDLLPNESVDVVFFDADHSLDGLARDVDAWRPKIKPGALLCGHDFSDGFPGIVRLVDERFPDRVVVPGTSIWTARR